MRTQVKGNGRREIWSFFSGAMGLDLGLEAAGLHPTLVNDVDPHCCDTIRRNRPDLQLIDRSIADLTAETLYRLRRMGGREVYMMVGGPPCQSFSPGGKRTSLSDPRGNLIYEYLRLIREVLPRYFLLENVANLTTAALRHRPIAERPGKHWNLKRYDTEWENGDGSTPPLAEDEKSGSAIRQILEDVAQLGYHVSFAVLDAADYGAPQHRLRFMMVGSRESPAPMCPSPTHGFGLRPQRTVRDAIYHLRHDPGAGSQYTAPVRSLFALVPEGGCWRDLPADLHREALGGAWDAGGGKTGFYRRLSWNAPSPTITTAANRKGSAMCHPTAHRPVSVRECAALQGFPDDWFFSGSMSTQYRQIGNAVPVPLARAVAGAFTAQRPNRSCNLDYRVMLDAAVARLRASARNKRADQPTLFP